MYACGLGACMRSIQSPPPRVCRMLTHSFSELWFRYADAQILSTFWELIPAAVSHALLGRLMKDLAFDARASAVRATVLEGVAFMVDCPLVHNTLKRMLPMLSPLLHDRYVRACPGMLRRRAQPAISVIAPAWRPVRDTP